MDCQLSFTIQTANYKNLNPAFLFLEKKACLLFYARKQLVMATFLSVVDHGDFIYMHASKSCLNILDSVYRAALTFMTDSNYCTHHCTLYQKAGLPSAAIVLWDYFLVE